MASPFPIFGGGSSAFPTFGAPVHQAKHGQGLFHGNILGNLLGDVGGFFAGLPAGLQSVGTAGYHAAQGHPGELGAIAAAIGNQYKQNYYDPFAKHGGLLSGSGWQHLGANLYNHPLAPILDVATVFTGGGAAAGKIGASIAKGAEASSAAAKIGESLAGLRRLTPAEFKALPQDAKLTKIPRTPDGGALVPRARQVIDSQGVVTHEFPGGVRRNPVIRARQDLAEKAYAKLSENNWFHPDKRGIRLSEAAVNRQTRTAKMVAAGHVMRTGGGLSKKDEAAAFYRASEGITTPAEYEHTLAKFKKWEREETNPRLKASQKARNELFVKAKDSILKPSDEMKAHEAAAHPASDMAQVARATRGASVDATPKQIKEASARVTEAKAKLASLPKDAPASTVTHHQGIVHSREAALEVLSATRAGIGRRMLGLPAMRDSPLAIVSHSESKLPRGIQRAMGKTSKGELKTAEDLHSTGMAFKHGLYNPSLKRIAQTLSTEVEHTGKLAKYTHLMQITRRLDPHDEAQMAAYHSGKLVGVHADSALAKQVGELANFLNERVAPLAERTGDASAAEMTKLLTDWSEAVSQEGSIMVIPRATMAEITKQTTEAVNWLQRALKTPTRIWRDLTLSLKGSFYVNNFLGNIMLGFISYGPEFFKELLDLRSSSSSGSLGKQILEHQPGVGHGIARDVAEQSARDMGAGARLNPLRLLSQSADAVANAGAKFTEQNFRLAGFAVELKRAARALAKNDGITEAKAIQNIFNDAKSVDVLSEKMYGDMLDYSKLTPFEKNYMRTMLPFWNFQRAITGRALRLTLDEPWKVQVMGKFGAEGDRTNNATMFKDVQGKIPGYLTGLVPIGKTVNGKTKVASSYAANPFSAVSDEAGQLASLIGGDAGAQQSPFAQFNPYIKSAIEAGTKQDLFFGSPLEGSRGSIYASQLASNFPQLAAYTNARYPNENSTMQRTLRQRGLQYAGANTGTFDVAALNRQNAINAYYANLAKTQAAKAKAKHDARDLGGIRYIPYV